MSALCLLVKGTCQIFLKSQAKFYIALITSHYVHIKASSPAALPLNGNMPSYFLVCSCIQPVLGQQYASAYLQTQSSGKAFLSQKILRRPATGDTTHIAITAARRLVLSEPCGTPPPRCSQSTKPCGIVSPDHLSPIPPTTLFIVGN